MRSFDALPRLEATAFLGFLATFPKNQLSVATHTEIRRFLVDRLRDDTDVQVRRQTLLSLSLDRETSECASNRIVDLLIASHNSWETFPVQLYVRNHRAYLSTLFFTSSCFRRRLQECDNPYLPWIIESLTGQPTPSSTP